MKRFSFGTVVTIMVAMAIMAVPVLADSLAINFESYSLGTVHNQDGWSSSGPYDREVVDPNGFGVSSFGSRSLRISNAITSGSFGDQTFSKSLIDAAGELTAEAGTTSGGTRQNYFEAQWDFASTVPGAEQPGLSVVASPDRGDGARMSWVQMVDTIGGLGVNFNDYQQGIGFVQSPVISGLDRAVPHTVKITMQFVDGPANDVVQVYVDGALLHTGTSWEDYFRDVEVNPTRTVDSILFRTAGTAAPGTLGNGFLIDNLSLFSGIGAPCVFTSSGTTMALQGDCVTDHTILVPDGFTLDGNGYTITAVDPAGGHFLGAVVKNAGSTAHVLNLTVTTSGLADACDAGNDGLRGILFDGAAGSIINNQMLDINQGASGCQEGNGIEARNVPLDTSGPDVVVTITGNTVMNYQKTGILVNGSVAATVSDNTITGVGPINYIAQNGIQVSRGGTGELRDNTISGNDYTPQSYVSCGVLYYQADGVRASRNTMFDNERDLCNFGKGGGTFNPNP
jgi:hypothetical protein